MKKSPIIFQKFILKPGTKRCKSSTLGVVSPALRGEASDLGVQSPALSGVRAPALGVGLR